MPAEVKVPCDPATSLGYKKLNRTWAKLEIVLGLTTAGAGLLVGGWTLAQQAFNIASLAGALALFVLGFYLALAGHRSHLYQSMNEQTALLIAEIRALQNKEP